MGFVRLAILTLLILIAPRASFAQRAPTPDDGGAGDAREVSESAPRFARSTIADRALPAASTASSAPGGMPDRFGVGDMSMRAKTVGQLIVVSPSQRFPRPPCMNAVANQAQPRSSRLLRSPGEPGA